MATLLKTVAFARPVMQLRRLAMPKQRGLTIRSASNQQQQVGVELQSQSAGQHEVQRQSQSNQPARRGRRPSLSRGMESTELAPMVAPFIPARVPSLLRYVLFICFCCF